MVDRSPKAHLQRKQRSRLGLRRHRWVDLVIVVVMVAPIMAEEGRGASTESTPSDTDKKSSEVGNNSASVSPESATTTAAGDAPAPEDRGKGFGGPGSVHSQVARDDKPKETLVPIPPLERIDKGLLDLRTWLRDSGGLTLAGDYNALVQGATKSLGEDVAAGGVFRLYGHWNWPGEYKEHRGSLVFKVENRHRLFTDVAPQQLGAEIGYSALTGITWSDAGWLLSNFYWYQPLFDKRLEFVVGFVDTTDYVDVYGLVNPWTDYTNSVFGSTPTIAFPSQGLGVGVRGDITQHVYAAAGFADANGDPTAPWDGFDTFFTEGEYFKHLELGWYSTREKRSEDNIHFTLWQTDSRSYADVPSGWGGALSASYLFEDRWLPYVRGGLSDGGGGALLEASAAVGLGYYLRDKSDLAAVGFNWGRPSPETYGSGLRDEYTFELLYRMHLLKRLSVTPDVQLLVHPANNPDTDLLAVFGLRARLAF